MDINSKKNIYSNLEKTFISRHILHQHWYTWPIDLPVRWNPQHRILLTVISATSAPPFRPDCHQRNLCHPVVNCFMLQILPSGNIYLWISFAKFFCPQKFLLFGSKHLKQSRHFDYWNQSLNISVHIYYLNCHEGGLCCYLVTHIENLLHPLQPFYFHLCPIYWTSLILL
jgi:hypothetical protein